MRFRIRPSLQGDWVDLLNNSEELILEEFRALFVLRLIFFIFEDMVFFFYEVFVLFVELLEHFVKVLSELEGLSFLHSFADELDRFVFQL